MQQRGGKNSKRMQSVAAFIGRLVFATAILLFPSARLFAEELLKSPSAFDNFGQFDPSLVEQWKEIEAALPAYPRDQDLIAMRMPVTYTLKVYLDEKSISLAKDGITRFTLVIETVSGNRNVLFEGYHCETREYKTYANGAPDKTFEAVKQSKWALVPYYDTNAFRYQLLRYYVCDPNQLSLALTPRALIHRLKSSMNE